MIFIIVVVAFPTTPTPTGTDMNYTAAVFCGVMILCVLYYYLPVYGGRYWFNGPKVNVTSLKGGSDDSGSGISVVEVLEKKG